jgi:type IV pilus assembly protein PilN
VKFDVLEYNGKDLITIQGLAASDQDILRLIDNLGKQKLIKQASLSSMKLPSKNKSQGGVQFKGFRVFVRIKG